MLGKLIKHELRATSRVMLPLLLALLIVTVLANLSFSYKYNDTGSHVSETSGSVLFDILSGIVIVIFEVGVLASILVAIVLMIQRFRSNILQDEGYVTLSLPVSIHSLIWSKLIVSAIWYLVIIGAVVLAIWGSVVNIDALRRAAVTIREVLDDISAENAINFTLMGLEALGLFFLGCVSSCLLFYASLATGHGFANRKMLLSVCAFFIFVILTQLVTELLSDLFNRLDLELPFLGSASSAMGEWHIMCLYIALALVCYGAVFYFITVFSLKRRLNLE